VRVSPPVPEGAAPAFTNGERLQLSADRRTMVVASAHPARALVELVKWIDQQRLELTDVQLKRPSLEDVFIELTGKSLRE
jgi:ABC-2 type transport system ATP-binding protein